VRRASVHRRRPNPATAGQVDVVVVKALDRLGRNASVIADTLAQFDAADVKLVIGGRELDRATPERHMHTDMEAVFAAYERRKIRVRTKSGLKERKGAAAPIVVRIFSMIEAGATFGDVARTLNAEVIVGRRRKPWVSRTVRTIVHNSAYTGEKGYAPIIDPSRWQAIQEHLRRLDPAAVQRRAGGRKPVDDAYFLRGVAHCRLCGSALHTRRQAIGRVYVCANRRQGTGLCNAEQIRAELIETHIVRHIEVFIGSAEVWAAEQVQQRTSEHAARRAALDLERASLAGLNRKVALAQAKRRQRAR
jgi:hypothetical protein